MIMVGSGFVLGPGYFMAWALRLPAHRRIFDAPIFSVSLAAVTAVFAGLLKIRWSIPTYLLLCALMIGVVWILIKGIRHFFHPPEAHSASKRTVVVVALIGAALGSLAICLQLKQAIITPESYSQSYDNIFHLNAIRYIDQYRDASSLTLNSLSGVPGTFAFYPAGWHDLVSLIYFLFPHSIPAATNATTFVVAALIWPLSMAGLAIRINRTDPVFAGSAGALSGAFLAFPGLTLKWGILYPNMLGLAILPSFLVIAIDIVSTISRGNLKSLPILFLTAVIAGAGLALAHPNSVTSAAVLILPLCVGRLVFFSRFNLPRPRQTGIRRDTLLRRSLLAFVTLICISVWHFVRPASGASTWPPTLRQSYAVGEFLTNAFQANDVQLLASVLMAVGVFSFARCAESRWLVWSWSLTGFLWVVVTSFQQGSVRNALTGPWYNDSFRLAALTVIVCLPMAAQGMTSIAGVLSQFVTSTGAAIELKKRLRVLVTVLAIVASAALCWTPSMQQATSSIRHEFTLSKDSLLITDDEQAVLDHIDNYVPPDAVIIVNPWQGSALAYALEDRKVTSYHSLSSPLPEYLPILNDLRNAGTDPAVCKAIRATDAIYLLQFDDTLDIGKDSMREYAGLQGVVGPPVVVPVFTSGDVGLYRVTACGF